MYMSIKIDDFYLRFPYSLPNDIEAFMIFYPRKFPAIVSYYQEIAKKVATDYKAFREYGNWAKDELWKGFAKINEDYRKGNQANLEFLVEIDQRLHKLCCFRFWVINYLFADGPLHDYFVTNLKALVRKFVDATEDIEDYERQVLLAERDLMQSDYADLYLDSAIRSIETAELLETNTVVKEYVDQASKLIAEHNQEKNTDKLAAIWAKAVEMIQDPKVKGCEALRSNLQETFSHARWVGKVGIIYNKLTHAIEFKEESKSLKKRHEEMKDRINQLKQTAREKLSVEDYEMFELSYEQAKNFGMYKDVMGAIDPEWLPMWFGLHKQVREIVKKPADSNIKNGGHSAIFYELVWFLSADLKNKVFSIDPTPFNLEDA